MEKGICLHDHWELRKELRFLPLLFTDASVELFQHVTQEDHDGALQADVRDGNAGDEAPTNIDMFQSIRDSRQQARERADRDGCCCDEGPEHDGRCRGGLGICPLYQQAQEILHRGQHSE